MIIEMECEYCGNKWEAGAIELADIGRPICLKCGDKNIKLKDASKSKVDYYQGSPAFSKKSWSDN